MHMPTWRRQNHHSTVGRQCPSSDLPAQGVQALLQRTALQHSAIVADSGPGRSQCLHQKGLPDSRPGTKQATQGFPQCRPSGQQFGSIHGPKRRASTLRSSPAASGAIGSPDLDSGEAWGGGAGPGGGRGLGGGSLREGGSQAAGGDVVEGLEGGGVLGAALGVAGGLEGGLWEGALEGVHARAHQRALEPRLAGPRQVRLHPERRRACARPPHRLSTSTRAGAPRRRAVGNAVGLSAPAPAWTW